MNPFQLLRIVAAHWKAALSVLLISVVAALSVSLLLPKRYTATAALIVEARSPDPIAALVTPASLATQVDVIGSERVAERVVAALGLVDEAGVRDQWSQASGGKGTPETWLAERLLGGLTVTPSRDGNILSISYTGGDPAFAAKVVNAFAQAYIDVTIDLKVEPARQYARWFGEQGKALRDSLEQAQTRLSAYQQASGIVSRDEQTDADTTRLNELSAQLVKVQTETDNARSKQRRGSEGGALPEIMDNGAVAGLRSDIIKQEAKLQEVAVNLGANHPQFQRMQSEIAALKQKLQSETARVASGFSASRNVGADRESSLRYAIDVQKRKLLESRGQRDQLAVLQRDVDAARNAYDAVSKRFTETELASQNKQANVSVLTPARAPLQPSFPKPLGKTMILAIGLGLLLGCGVAYLLEMLDRRIRSVADLAEALPIPVLGVIGKSKPRSRYALPGSHLPKLRKAG